MITFVVGFVCFCVGCFITYLVMKFGPDVLEVKRQASGHRIHG